MTATTAPSSRRAARGKSARKSTRGKNAPKARGVNFFRVLRSEWIKVFTVPSTVILLSCTFAVMVGLAALFAWSLVLTQQRLGEAGAGELAERDPEMADRMAAVESFADVALQTPSSGLIFGQLLIASLAVVLIASEWSTGMVRSTMIAVPRRTPVLLAKAIIIAALAFAIGSAAALLSTYVAQPILAAEDMQFGLSAEGVLPSIVNTGTYLACIAVISLAIGTLLRNTAGGVVTAVALFFVLPVIVLNLISGLAEWIPDAARFLPTEAGDQLVSISTAEGNLTQWQGGLVMAAWAVVLLAVSMLVARRKDV
jgi:hypothetical protein